jgi:hypothetical protein
MPISFDFDVLTSHDRPLAKRTDQRAPYLLPPCGSSDLDKAEAMLFATAPNCSPISPRPTYDLIWTMAVHTIKHRLFSRSTAASTPLLVQYFYGLDLSRAHHGSVLRKKHPNRYQKT